jgi:hypothetical protein
VACVSSLEPLTFVSRFFLVVVGGEWGWCVGEGELGGGGGVGIGIRPIYISDSMVSKVTYIDLVAIGCRITYQLQYQYHVLATLAMCLSYFSTTAQTPTYSFLVHIRSVDNFE